MIKLPKSFLDSLQDVKGFNPETFLDAHQSPQPVISIRINPAKSPFLPGNLGYVENRSGIPGIIDQPIPWTTGGFYLKSRPSFTFDPLFHAGCYYVQEASSMFLEQALQQTVDLSEPLKVLDLCAAPGGKSTHIHSLITKDSLLVSNEVIRSRVNVLKDNIIKWGCNNVVITNNDPGDFTRLQNYFDVIVVDAPCSGSGLFRRDPAAIDEWSENNVQLCSKRQQRIVADVWPALKKDGLLIYSTCSYSKEEDEEIMDWITGHLDALNYPLELNNDWNIIQTITAGGNKGYRFWPDKLKGEGFFLSVFQKKDGIAPPATLKVKNKREPVSEKELQLIELSVQTDTMEFIKYQQTVYAWPEKRMMDFNYLLETLRVIYSGTICGELMKNKMVPSHALALSHLLHQSTEKIDLNMEQAIRFLQRKELDIVLKSRGWKIVSYQNKPLGWINVLANRINNYYPKELRIIKEN